MKIKEVMFQEGVKINGALTRSCIGMKMILQDGLLFIGGESTVIVPVSNIKYMLVDEAN